MKIQPPQGISMDFLASYEEKKFFSQRDSFPGVVLDSLNKVYENKVPVEVVKLSHHASAHYKSPELIEKFDSDNYLIPLTVQITITRQHLLFPG